MYKFYPVTINSITILRVTLQRLLKNYVKALCYFFLFFAYIYSDSISKVHTFLIFSFFYFMLGPHILPFSLLTRRWMSHKICTATTLAFLPKRSFHDLLFKKRSTIINYTHPQPIHLLVTGFRYLRMGFAI